MTTKLLTILLEWLYSFGEGIMNLASKLLLTLNSSGAGQTAAEAYAAKVLAYSPTVYYKLNEASGTTVANYGSVGSSDPTHRFSDIAGASLGPDGVSPAPTYVAADGDATNPYSAGLAAVFNFTDQSLSYWWRFDGNWASASGNYLFRWQGSGSNTLHCFISSVGVIRFLYQGGGTTRDIYVTAATAGVNDGNWHHTLCTFNVTGNVFTVYMDGSVAGTPTTCPSWSATGLTTGNTALAARETVPATTSWQGSIADMAIIPSVLDGTAATALATYGA